MSRYQQKEVSKWADLSKSTIPVMAINLLNAVLAIAAASTADWLRLDGRQLGPFRTCDSDGL